MYLVIVLTCLAKSTNMTIYSIDAYNMGVGGQAKINRVTFDGVQTNNIGHTKGSSRQGTFNLGLEALRKHGGF